MASYKPCVWKDVAITSGGSVVVSGVDAGTTMNICLNGSVAVVGLTITLPTIGIQDGQLVKFSANVGITALTINAEGTGIIQGLITSLVGGGNGIYQYRKDNNTWYKFAA